MKKDDIDKVLMELSKSCDRPTDITICGGASMVLNYETRQSTMDIDCFRLEQRLKDNAIEIAASLGLEADWLNDNVCVTQSYTDALIKYRTEYGTFGNLKVYTVKGLPLLCMKLVSFRPHSSDIEDCRALISILKDKVSVEDVRYVVYQIYGDTTILSVDAELFLAKEYEHDGSYLLDEESLDSYCEMISKNLISIDSVPQEFRAQVERRLNKHSNKSFDNAIEALLSI